MSKLHKILLASTMVISAQYATAGTSIVFEEAGGNAPAQIDIEDGKIRMETSESNDGYMIFDNNAKTFTVIMPSERKYMVMDEQTAKDLKNTINKAMQQMEAQLANVPASQRKMIKDMMEQQMGSIMDAVPEVSFAKTGKSDTWQGQSCELIQIKLDGSPSGTQCVVDPESLGVPADDMNTMEGMFNFMLDLTAQFASNAADISMSMEYGMPVKYTQNGETAQMKEISQGDIDNTRFAIPEGYSEQKMDLPQGMF